MNLTGFINRHEAADTSSTFAMSVCAALCMHKKGCHHCHTHPLALIWAMIFGIEDARAAAGVDLTILVVQGKDVVDCFLRAIGKHGNIFHLFFLLKMPYNDAIAVC